MFISFWKHKHKDKACLVRTGFIICLIFLLCAPPVWAQPTGTGGFEFPLGSDAGDDFNVGSGMLVIEGDASQIGIGTTAPNAALEVFASGTGEDVTVVNADTGTDGVSMTLHHDSSSPANSDTVATIDFAGEDSGGAEVDYARISTIINTFTGDEAGEMVFSVAKAGNMTEAMRIDENGYVGIGTTTQGASLEVNNTGTAIIAEDANGDYFRVIGGGTASYTYDFIRGQLQLKAGGATRAEIALTSSTGRLVLNDSVGTQVSLRANADSYINSGNVGVGTIGPVAQLEVQVADTDNVPGILIDNNDTTNDTAGLMISMVDQSGIPLFITPQANQPSVSTEGALYADTDDNLYYYDGTNWVDLTAGGSTTLQDADTDTKIQVEETGDEDKIRFDTAGAERMIITDTGLVGIGTTVPTTSGLLHVEGQCVTGDTRLRRRRRRKRRVPEGSSGNDDDDSDDECRDVALLRLMNGRRSSATSLQDEQDEYVYDEVRIDEIQPGDEIASMDEATGAIVYSRVNALMDMGIKPIYKLTTESGKTIRTTGNHPYFVRQGYTNSKNIFSSIRNVFPKIERDVCLWRNKCNARSNRSLEGGWIRNIRMPWNLFGGYWSVIEKSMSLVKKIRFSFFANWMTVLSEVPGDTRLTLCPSAQSQRTTSWRKFSSARNCIRRGSNTDHTATFSHMGRILKSGFNMFFGQFGVGITDNRLGRLAISQHLKNHVDHNTSSLKAGLAVANFRTDRDVRFDVHAESITHHQKSSMDPVTNENGRWTKVTEIREGQFIAVAEDKGMMNHARTADERVARRGMIHHAQYGNDHAQWEKIVKIEHLPAEQVWDIEVEGTHNFVAGHYINRKTGKALTEEEARAYAVWLSEQTVLGGLPSDDPGNPPRSVHGYDYLNLGQTSGDCVGETNANPRGLFAFDPNDIVYGGLIAHNTYISGNVGVGTTSPTAKMEVSSTGTSEDLTVINTDTGTDGVNMTLHHDSSSPENSDTVATIDFAGEDSGGAEVDYARISTIINTFTGDEAGEMIFSVAQAGNMTEAMRIDENGYVGIGISAPAAPVHIQTTTDRFIKFMAATGRAFVDIETNYNSDPVLRIEGTGGADLVNVFDGGTEIFTILDGGNVGVGTTNPTAKMEVSSTGTSEDLTVINTDTGTDGVSMTLHHDSASPANSDTVATIDFAGEDSGGAEVDYARISTIINTFTGDEAGELIFSVAKTGSLTEAMRIDANGDVGIGMSAPTSGFKLDVNGSGLFQDNLRVGGTTGSLLWAVEGDALYVSTIQSRNSSEQLKLIGRETSGSGNPSVHLSTSSGLNANDIAVRMDAVDGGSMVLLKSGNVGIGIDSPVAHFEVEVADGDNVPGILIDNNDTTNDTAGLMISMVDQSGIPLFITPQANQPSVSTEGALYADTDDNLYYYDGTNWVDLTASTSSMQDDDGDTKIQVEETGDEDKIRFDTGGTERMIIDDSGNIGIGTIAPTDKLHLFDDTDNAIVLQRVGSANTAEWRYNGGSMIFGTMNNDDVLIRVNNEDVVAIDGDAGGTFKYVGIGTTAPSAKLEISNSDAGEDLTVVNADAGADGVNLTLHHDSTSPNNSDVIAVIDFAGEDSGGTEVDYARISTIINTFTGDEAGELIFSVAKAGNMTEAMRIDENGYVGIGTTGPTSALHLPSENEVSTPTISFGDGDSGFYEAGDDVVNISLGGVAQWSFVSSNLNADNGGGPRIISSTSSATVPVLIPNRTSGGNAGIGGDGVDGLYLITAGSTGLAVDPNQNVGIGTTGPVAQLEVEVADTDNVPGVLIDNNDTTNDTAGLMISMVDQSGIPLFITPQANEPSVSTEGSLYADTDDNLYYYDGTNWVDLTASTSSMQDADGDTKIQVEETGDEDKIRFDTAGSERMIITDTGLVGIGTISPQTPLNVVAEGASGGSGITRTMIRIEETSGVDANWELGVINANNSFELWGGWEGGESRRLLIDGSSGDWGIMNGNVGIGTTAPTALLETFGASTTEDFRVTNADSGTDGVSLSLHHDSSSPANSDTVATIDFAGEDSGGTEVDYARISTIINTFTGDEAGEMIFSVAKAGNMTEAMRIDENGYVGIGTVGPTEKLNIHSGNIKISTDTNTEVRYVEIDGFHSSGSSVKFGINDPSYQSFVGSAINTDFKVIARSGSSQMILGSNKIRFRINSIDQIFMGATGSVGIGTTSPSGHLEVKVDDNENLPGILIDNNDTTNDTAGLMISMVDQSGIPLFITPQANQPSVSTEGSLYADTDDNLYYYDGTNWVDLTASTSSLQDTDGDTKIQVEETGDEDKIRFDTAGTERMIIDDSGNVGIGTDVPGYKFSIGSTDTSDAIGIYHDNTDAYFKTDDGWFIFQTDEGATSPTYVNIKGNGTGDPFLSMDEDGNVRSVLQLADNGGSLGILPGQTATNLYVFPWISSGNPSMYIWGYDSGAATAKNGLFNVDSAGDFNIEAQSGEVIRFRTGGADQVTIDNSGNIGIGTTVPIAKLDVLSSSTGEDFTVINTDTGTDGVSMTLHHDSASPANSDTVATIDFAGEDSGGAEVDYARISTIINTFTGDEAGELIFSVAKTGNMTEAMRIDESGDVGVGIAAPEADLHVWNESAEAIIKVSSNLGSNGNAFVMFEQADEVGGGDSPWIIGARDSADTFAISNATTFGLSKEYFLISNTGNVGIGESAPQVKMDILSAGNEIQMLLSDKATNAATKDAFVALRHYTNAEESIALFGGRSESSTSSLWVGGTPSGYNLENAVTDIKFFTAADSTTLNGSEKVRIDRSGNVGIGASAPKAHLEIQVANTDNVPGVLIDNNDTTNDTAGLMISMVDQSGIPLFITPQANQPSVSTEGSLYADTDDNLYYYDGTNWVDLTASTSSLQDTDGDTKIQVEETGDEDKIRFDTAGSERMIIDDSGNVGIGTDVPSVKLHVRGGDVQVDSDEWIGASSDYGVKFAQAGDGAYVAVNSNGNIFLNLDVGNNDADSRKLIIAENASNTSGTALMTIQDTGSVGIGTTAPTALLETFGTSTTEDFRITNAEASADGVAMTLHHDSASPANSDTVATIDFAGEDSGGSEVDYARISTIINTFTGDEAGELIFSVAKAGSLTEAMRVDENGYVGIGTTAPGAELEVNGVIRADSIYNDSSELMLNAQNGAFRFSDDNTAMLQIRMDRDKDQIIWGLDDDAGNQFVISRQGNVGQDHDHIVQVDPTFYIHSDTSPDTDNTQWLSFAHTKTNAIFGLGTGAYIFQDGNVGIGTTNVSAKLEVEVSDTDNVPGILIDNNDTTNDTAGLMISMVDQSGIPLFITPQTNEPAVSTEGALYADSDADNLYYYDGTNWVDLTASTGSLQDTDGDTKIQVEETGDEDKIRFDTANVERMIIDNNGGVGIGTTSPVANLHVQGGNAFVKATAAGDGFVVRDVAPSSGFGLAIQYNDGSDTLGYGANYRHALSYSGGESLAIVEGGTEYLVVESGGEIGIGTVAPITKLNVYGAGGIANGIRIDSTGTNSSGFLGLEAGTVSPNAGKISFGDGSGWKLYFGTAGSDLITFVDTGKIGIGVTAPTAKLEVSDSGTGEDFTVINTDAGTDGVSVTLHHDSTSPTNSDTVATIDFAGEDSGGAEVDYARISTIINTFTGDEAGEMIFSVAKTGALTEAMRIDENGYVGIGTTEPNSLLHFVQNADDNAISLTGFDDQNMQVATIAMDSGGALALNNSGDKVKVSGTEFQVIATLLNVNNTNGLRLNDSDGSFPNRLLRIGTDSDYGIGYYPTDDTLQIVDGSAINTNVRMAIDSSGNVGIGTTAPVSALHVPDGKYFQAEDNNAGAPAAGDCDDDTERGRMSIDTSNNRLYVCNGAARGWDYVALTD